MAYDKMKDGKARLCGIDPHFIHSLAKVQEFGDTKHAAHHWTEGVSYRLVLEAVKRHIEAIELGYCLDPDTNEHHAAHAALGLMYIAHYDRDLSKFGEFNDLPFARRNHGMARNPVSQPDPNGRPDQVPGGSGGVVQGPTIKGRAGRPTNPNAGFGKAYGD